MKQTSSNKNWPIIGHSTQIKFLKQSLHNKKFNHAYIFCGPNDIGKKAVAKLFSQSIICENFKNNIENTPCQKCQNCIHLSKGIYPDYFEINVEPEKKDISIEQIKELQYNFKLKSFLEGHKIVIIDEADKLNDTSANALLKTLEEPFEDSIIILVVENLKNVLPTIISRCQIVKFNYVNEDLIYDYLKKKEEKRENIRLVAKFINGQPGLLFQESLDEYINIYKDNIEYIEQIINSKDYQKIKIIDEILKDCLNKDLEKLVNIWLIYFHDLFLLKTLNYEKIINQGKLNSLKILEKKYSLEKILHIFKALIKIPDQLQKNINPKILIENLILNI